MADEGNMSGTASKRGREGLIECVREGGMRVKEKEREGGREEGRGRDGSVGRGPSISTL